MRSTTPPVASPPRRYTWALALLLSFLVHRNDICLLRDALDPHALQELPLAGGLQQCLHGFPQLGAIPQTPNGAAAYEPRKLNFDSALLPPPAPLTSSSASPTSLASTLPFLCSSFSVLSPETERLFSIVSHFEQVVILLATICWNVNGEKREYVQVRFSTLWNFYDQFLLYIARSVSGAVCLIYIRSIIM
jgi:hypothetical protein